MTITTRPGRRRGLCTRPRGQGWRERAECRFLAPSLFFPDDRAGVEAARAVCRICPVQQECLEYALAHNLTYGIWGGYSERARISRSVVVAVPAGRAGPKTPSAEPYLHR